mgnify:FL=1
MEGFLNILFCFLQAVFRNDPVRCFLRRIMIDKYAIPYTDCGKDKCRSIICFDDLAALLQVGFKFFACYFLFSS